MRPRRALRALVGSGFVLCGLLLSAGLWAQPPDWIGNRDPERGQPVWVSEEQLKTASGELRWDLLSPWEQAQVERQIDVFRGERASGRIDTPGDPCAGAGAMFAEYFVMNPSVYDLAEHSTQIFSGVVRGRPVQGIHRGNPSTLYAVEVEEVLKGGETLSPGETLHVAYPEAQIRVGDAWLCTRSHRYPERPVPGRRILVFSHEKPNDLDPVFVPMDVELFFETRDSISVPEHLEPILDVQTLEGIEEIVRSPTDDVLEP